LCFVFCSGISEYHVAIATATAVRAVGIAKLEIFTEPERALTHHSPV
jgi:hypothetical protein